MSKENKSNLKKKNVKPIKSNSLTENSLEIKKEIPISSHEVTWFLPLLNIFYLKTGGAICLCILFFVGFGRILKTKRKVEKSNRFEQQGTDLLISQRLLEAEKSIEGINLDNDNFYSNRNSIDIPFKAHNSNFSIIESDLNSAENDSNDHKIAEDFEYDDNLIAQEVERVKREIESFQKFDFQDNLSIPLCVPYEDKEIVKSLGANWSIKEKAWFWPFTKSRESIKNWLPKIYQPLQPPPYILPQLVPQPLWGKNLRSLLTSDQWKLLRTKSYEQFGYRCCRCGCKGTKWPVECNEIWDYEISPLNNHGTVYFQGLESLCPSCHQIIHIGKAYVDGQEYQAIARLIFLNKWTISEAKEAVIKAFQAWEKRSEIEQWTFNFDTLEKIYGIKISENNIKEAFLQNTDLHFK